MTVDGLRCRVIGVLARNDRFGFNVGFDWNELIVIPAAPGRDWFPDMPQRTLALLVTDAPSNNDVVMRILNARLVSLRHGIDDFQLIDFAGMLRGFYLTFVILEVIALLGGGEAALLATSQDVSESDVVVVRTAEPPPAQRQHTRRPLSRGQTTAGGNALLAEFGLTEPNSGDR